MGEAVKSASGSVVMEGGGGVMSIVSDPWWWKWRRMIHGRAGTWQ